MLINALFISIKVTFISVFISLVMVFVILYFKKLKFLENIIMIPLFLPPSAIGYVLLTVLGNNSFFGQFLYNVFGIKFIFSQISAILVGIVVSLPIIYQTVQNSISNISIEILDSAKSCGANNITIFSKIIIPLSKNGIYMGLILGIARVFGEFGATILLAGNISGKTQTIALAMYTAIQNNDRYMASMIFITILCFAIIMQSIYKYLKREGKYENYKNN